MIDWKRMIGWRRERGRREGEQKEEEWNDWEIGFLKDG